IEQLDYMPPQVMIGVLVAEVDMNNSEEFGVEIGLQNPVLFQRSLIPNPFGASDSVSFTNTGVPANVVSPGATVTTTTVPSAFPGFNFNTTNPLGNNPNINPG